MRVKEEWELVPLKVEDVVSFPEDCLGWDSPCPSLTQLSRSSVKRVTAASRRIMEKGRNSSMGQETISYSRAEWGMWCERTLSEDRKKEVTCKGNVFRRDKFIDGSFTLANLVGQCTEQTVRYVEKRHMKLVESADSNFCLCAVPIEVSLGNARLMEIEPGHQIRVCTALKLRFRCLDSENIGCLLIIATFKTVVVQKEQGFVEAVFVGRGDPPPPPGPPPAPEVIRARPPPNERIQRVAKKREAEASLEKTKKLKKIVDDGADLLGRHWYDAKLGLCTVARTGKYGWSEVLFYTHARPDEDGAFENCSSVAEVRAWCQPYM